MQFYISISRYAVELMVGRIKVLLSHSESNLEIGITPVNERGVLTERLINRSSSSTIFSDFRVRNPFKGTPVI